MVGQCHHCNGYYELQPEWVGKAVTCPHCHQVCVAREAGVVESTVVRSETVETAQDDSYVEAASCFPRYVALIIDNLIVCLLFMCYYMVRGYRGDDLFLQLRSINLYQEIFGMFFEGFFLSRFGATPGKMVIGLKVLHDGQYPSMIRAVLRSLCRILFVFDYIVAFFNDDHKALHDYICDTVVYKK